MIAIQAASALIDRSACVTVASCAVGRRFNELKREVDGISQRMLTLTVRGLERDGLLTRTMTPSIPPRVDYALTELGRSLLEPVNALGTWAVENRTTVDAARQAFDADATH